MRHSIVFGAMYVIALFVDLVFVCQTYELILLKLRLFETVKEHQNKEIHSTKKTMNSAANKTTTSCTIS